VNQPRHPFRINVGFLFNQPIGYIREIPFEFACLTFSNEFKFSEFSGTATFHRTQNGLRLLGNFKAETKVTCARCLEDFNLPVETKFEEVFTYPNHPLSENEDLIPENGYLDLEELIGDFLMLEIPINPLCKADCKGLCRECGQDLNLSACMHSYKLQVVDVRQSLSANKLDSV
jgi:uncharacterized protein